MTTATKKKTAAATPATTSAAKIEAPKFRKLKFTITGHTPYLSHNWTQKALASMRMTAQERKKVPKVARDPEGEAEAAAYRVQGGAHDGEYGVPAMAVKSAMLDSAHKDRGLPRTEVARALRFVTNGVIPMRCSEPIIREDIVRVGNGKTDLRYRPEFAEWSVDIELVYDADIINPSDIINLANRAGHSVGIGEWRPQKYGEHGRFEVDTTQPVVEGKV